MSLDEYTSRPLTYLQPHSHMMSARLVAEVNVVEAARKWAALYVTGTWKVQQPFFTQEEIALLQAVEHLVAQEEGS